MKSNKTTKKILTFANDISDDFEEFVLWRRAGLEEIIDCGDESYVSFFVQTNGEKFTFDVDHVFSSLEDAAEYYKVIALDESHEYKKEIEKGEDVFTVPEIKCVIFKLKAVQSITANFRTGKVEIDNV